MSHPVRITILGSGTSAGVPVIGCDCGVCRSDDPRDRRTRCSAIIETVDARGQHRVLFIDTSPDLREQAIRHRIRRCDAILLTHHHVDHVWGLDEVRRFNAVMRMPIDIYAEPRTMQNVRRVYPHIFDREKNTNDSFVATLIPHHLAVEQPIRLFGLRITPIRILHGRLPILGFRIEHESDSANSPARASGEFNALDPLPFAYCTDASAIPPESWPRLCELNTLVLNALRYRHHPTHFNVDQSIRTAEEIAARQTYFIHMTHDIMHADLDAQLPEGIHLAHDGLQLGALPIQSDEVPPVDFVRVDED
jgi:phosphoribosyl 1,2-cyclic phosphate phosphodiesterase